MKSSWIAIGSILFIFLILSGFKYYYEDGYNKGYESKTCKVYEELDGWRITPGDNDLVFKHNEDNNLSRYIFEYEEETS